MGSHVILKLYFICVIYSNIWNIFIVCQSLSKLTATRASKDKKDKNLTVDVSTTDWSVKCRLQANGFDCLDGGTYEKYYYDSKAKDCKTGDIGIKCLHNINMFSNIHDCHTSCRDEGEHPLPDNLGPSVYCRLQPEFGDCDSYHPSFYFDMTTRQCRGFSYSGCGGNQNRFSSFQLCSTVCVASVRYLPKSNLTVIPKNPEGPRHLDVHQTAAWILPFEVNGDREQFYY